MHAKDAAYTRGRNVVWLADTNYRIDLDNDRVRTLALMDDFDALLAADQVCVHPSTVTSSHVRSIAEASHGRRRSLPWISRGAPAIPSDLQV